MRSIAASLACDRASKLKKRMRLPFLGYGSLRLPFLGYGSLERRHELLCREELWLNRPLAPDVRPAVRWPSPRLGGVRVGDEDAPGALEDAVGLRPGSGCAGFVAISAGLTAQGTTRPRRMA
jgi:aminoglycoside phosphotransferase family enzyme